MTFGEVYRKGKSVLARAGNENPSFDASCLFEKAFGAGRQQRILSERRPADPERAEAFFSMARERAAGQPLQYLLGEWPFLGLTLEVGEGVLIPREETELLVRTAAGMLRKNPSPRVLDLCAGSGAVALGLISLLPGARACAVEWMDAAFGYLEKNIEKTGCRRSVKATRRDVLDPASAAGFAGVDGIVSNPPYVAATEIPSLQREVLHEPREALDGGADGLAFYRAIAGIWVPVLKPGGILAVEIGEGQAKPVSALFSAAGLTGLAVKTDFNGFDRVVAAHRPDGEN